MSELKPKSFPMSCPNEHRHTVRVVKVGQEQPRDSNVVACHACGVTAAFVKCAGCDGGFWRWEHERRRYHSDDCRAEATKQRRKQRIEEERREDGREARAS